MGPWVVLGWAEWALMMPFAHSAGSCDRASVSKKTNAPISSRCIAG